MPYLQYSQRQTNFKAYLTAVDIVVVVVVVIVEVVDVDVGVDTAYSSTYRFKIKHFVYDK